MGSRMRLGVVSGWFRTVIVTKAHERQIEFLCALWINFLWEPKVSGNMVLLPAGPFSHAVKNLIAITSMFKRCM